MKVYRVVFNLTAGQDTELRSVFAKVDMVVYRLMLRLISRRLSRFFILLTFILFFIIIIININSILYDRRVLSVVEVQSGILNTVEATPEVPAIADPIDTITESEATRYSSELILIGTIVSVLATSVTTIIVTFIQKGEKNE